MIIALVGCSHSGKDSIAKLIKKVTDGRFTRMKFYTTRSQRNKKRQMFMSEEELRKIPDSDIVYCMLSETHFKYFVTKEQFAGDQDGIYIVDDPRGLDGLRTLGVPYAVVYVDSSMDTIKARTVLSKGDIKKVKLRIRKISSRMKKFERSNEYSLYLNTSDIGGAALESVVSLFCAKVMRWVETRGEHEFCMPTLYDCYGSGWSKKDKVADYVPIGGI